MIRIGSGFKMQIKKRSKNGYDATCCRLIKNYNTEFCSTSFLSCIVHKLFAFSFFLALLGLYFKIIRKRQKLPFWIRSEGLPPQKEDIQPLEHIEWFHMTIHQLLHHHNLDCWAPARYYFKKKLEHIQIICLHHSINRKINCILTHKYVS